VLTKGLVAGMEIVGADFRDGILFVPEVLLAAKAMKAGMAILRPLLAETGAREDRQAWSSAPSRATSTTSARTWWR
jgi:methanogenic corrinoid protein MtbC1